MSEEEAENDAEAQAEEPDVEVSLERGDAFHLEDLREQFGDELIDADLQEVVKNRVRQLNDNREAVAQQLAQAQQQATRGPQ